MNTQKLRGLAAGALVVGSLLVGCHESATINAGGGAETAQESQAVPSFQQPSTTGATSGRATSETYTMTFSLGGDMPSAGSESFQLNTPESQE